ncbi:helix-turn-helix domain-containing protein [Roseobacter sp. HKCCD9010]|uniref:helix-turn-helix transcriptional regulator n=1 Tax=unclassified Roseobacter TaxID=196798 RepID=UPI0014917157|nr:MULTISPECIES: helix-turn-helix transcriptional regulator [unclassified Roseobacter]MBF9051969.1 helix-turn-helix domain-containing protein [Rhodobacterales bacterium HKCCD4356]NNV10314.1 helix-turn-helix domain-containing protein [Roseobacter sp. HKCCD7357]NNV18134.1 helix-turn-helix domain-containing protein [Roseobacter sp. HKCCD8768]NNV27594.1 helix-turn-helix domain-containing protein [Roseobacter sp. HKCCD8192]NNV31860.1 helix-turn-helix domain-containing protein [Roseobacter sp. HKCCD
MEDFVLPDHEYLTVKELADLLRLKERKIYDLASSGSVPCSRATGKLLFPAAEIRAWIEQAKSGGVAPPERRAEARPPIILGSHDPLLDWAIRQSRCGLASYYDGSLDGLDRFTRGEGVAAGLHIHDAKSDRWNVPAVSAMAADQNAVLVTFAARQRGLVYHADGFVPAGLSDLAGGRFVPRQTTSGTETLFREIAKKEGLDLSRLKLADVARTEDEAVEAVRRGNADVTFGLKAVAQSYGLEFLPVIEEQFALIVDRKSWFDTAMQKLLRFCATTDFERRAQAYGGYDTAELGKVIWNAR